MRPEVERNQSQKSCILFTSKDTEFLAQYATKALSEFFDVKAVYKFNRGTPSLNGLKDEIEKFGDFDYLFNFLSPKLIPKWLLDASKIAAINFHPAAYEYPGVGSAAYSIFDEKAEYGVSAHYMTEVIDDGGIIAEKFFRQDALLGPSELFESALTHCCLLLNDVIALLREVDRPKVIRTWSRPAITRAEFRDWMLIKDTDTKEIVSKKILALNHPIYPGPFFEVHGYLFSYIGGRHIR
jgi:methionyl-tRNA formyltransferase